ncbi:MAG TPA: PTS sugar transporter subunit IIA [Candidatus Deferrimicrobiaceae bacterium]|nr:PTS sugar transporter subunit IIA [Candidatus Deferrimicrobiaceae bacterium]
MIRRAGRGRLKVYLGYGAGVGKTYQMLLEGHRLKDEGIDVVVGLVETHGRAETAKLIEGLEVVPRRRQEYRSVVLEEMDLSAVLARKPQVALIDELAHTNVPGSRNPKRYQDVQDILAEGIHVITTLNIQHLESLYDMVEKATHVKIRERIPDTVLGEADQLVNVDLTTEDLRKRLLEGKVYPPERIQTALENFFKAANLEKLRELTLRELASQIDQRRRETPEEEAVAAPDQIMVCLSSRGPKGEALLRYASRLAGKLNRNWYAVYVQTPSEEPTVIDAHTQRILSGTLILAKQLGAMVFTYKGEDIADTLLRFAREYRVGTIVVGSPTPLPAWKRWMGERSTVDRLIHNAMGMTVVVLDTREEEAAHPRPTPERGISEAPPPRTTEGTVPPASRLPVLSNLISTRGIVIWNQPVRKELALRTLVDAAVSDSGIGDPATVLGLILKREEEGSTFFNEGVAFPHARVENLENPIVAMGVTRQGVEDLSLEKPVEYIFLVLTPAESPDSQVQILGILARVSRNRHFLLKIRSCRTPEEVLSAVQDWEAQQAVSIVEPAP